MVFEYNLEDVSTPDGKYDLRQAVVKSTRHSFNTGVGQVEGGTCGGRVEGGGGGEREVEGVVEEGERVERRGVCLDLFPIRLMIDSLQRFACPPARAHKTKLNPGDLQLQDPPGHIQGRFTHSPELRQPEQPQHPRRHWHCRCRCEASQGACSGFKRAKPQQCHTRRRRTREWEWGWRRGDKDACGV